MSYNIKASELQTALVMRSDAVKFSNALRETLAKLPANTVIDSQQFSTYYDSVRKAPVYSCLLSFHEESDELVDLNETVSPENSCSCDENCNCKNHDNVVDTPSDTASGNDSVVEDEG